MTAVQIPVGPDHCALIDCADVALVTEHEWTPWMDGRRVYARTSINRKHMAMHRLIMAAPRDRQIDHKNHNGLDNRRENLRECTNQQNRFNSRHRLDAVSRFKGVSFHRAGARWQATIGIDSKLIHLGLFDAERDAAIAYDYAARRLHGEFACLNFPDQEHPYPREHRRGRDGYRGVTYCRHLSKWAAVVCIGGGKQRHLGVFATADEAARAYDNVALQVRGHRARLNFPTEAPGWPFVEAA